MTPPKKDLSMQFFGRLFVICETTRVNYQSKWWCHCECGNFVEVFGGNLTRGHTQSCGCLCIERTSKANTIHGDAYKPSTTPYPNWQSMRRRCLSPSSDNYIWYGGKGITICPEWDDYAVFKEWAVLNGWRKGLTIDRINPMYGYYPWNCEWVTPNENARRARKYAHHKSQEYS